MADPIEAFDKIETRCPQLGGEVLFGYCRKMDSGLPCSRALICFQLLFPVELFFRKILKEETFKDCFETLGEGRLERFLRTIDEAKEILSPDGPDPTRE